jgi:hypothetical protein
MKASESLSAQAWVVVTVFITLRALMKPATQPPSKRRLGLAARQVAEHFRQPP